MHPNPVFRQVDTQASLALVDRISFGTLCVSTEDAPLLSHIPFQLSSMCDSLELHLVRSNPIARAAAKTSLSGTIAVLGPHGYISPDWYQIADQVPTWNYVAVHLIGTLTPLDQSTLPEVLDHLSNHFENQLAPKSIWKQDKVATDALEKMHRQIVPFRFDISDVQSTWKLGQNKPKQARIAAAAALEASSLGTDTKMLAKMMREIK